MYSSSNIILAARAQLSQVEVHRLYRVADMVSIHCFGKSRDLIGCFGGRALGCCCAVAV